MTAHLLTALIAVLLLATPARAQFADNFDSPSVPVDQDHARAGWAFRTGDGEATMDFAERGGHGLITVDARHDRRNIWWAMVRRSVSTSIDARTLARPDRELRVEARIRSSAAPRRVNLHFNHSRTTNFHSHLMEYDLPDTGWHTISFTTDGFDAEAKDEVFVQMAMMDWGRERFEVEIDYIKVDVVDPALSGPDIGNPLPYRPEAPLPAGLVHHVPSAADATIDSAWPDVSLAGWADLSEGYTPALSVGHTQMIALRFDLSPWRGRKPAGWGVLELTTEAVQRALTRLEEFGELRVVEILGGDPDWSRHSVTRNSLFAGQPETRVLGQMMIDMPPGFARGGKTQIPVSPPVLERLLSGRTKGLAIEAQGAIVATFRSSESIDPEDRPMLHFTVE
jgi:hypothetical protein